MFKESMNNGKTRVTIELSDSTLLRMKVLMLIKNPGKDYRMPLGEFIDSYFEDTVDQYIESEFGGDYTPMNPQSYLLYMIGNSKVNFSEQDYLEFGRWEELPPEKKTDFFRELEECELLKDEYQRNMNPDEALFFIHKQKTGMQTTIKTVG